MSELQDKPRKSQDMVGLGARIAKMRHRAGLTRAQIAARITDATGQPCSERSVEHWEAGRVDIPCSRIYQIARAVGCDASELMCPPPAGAPR